MPFTCIGSGLRPPLNNLSGRGIAGNGVLVPAIAGNSAARSALFALFGVDQGSARKVKKGGCPGSTGQPIGVPGASWTVDFGSILRTGPFWLGLVAIRKQVVYCVHCVPGCL
jgi:hypothetical protein